MAAITPRYATIPDWCVISGLSRSITYELIGLGCLKAIKVGARTLGPALHVIIMRPVRGDASRFDNSGLFC